MPTSVNTSWEKCLGLIRKSIPVKQYETWFEPLQLVSLQEGRLTVGVPSKYFYEYFDKNLAAYFMQAVRRCFEGELQLQYILVTQPEARTTAAPPPDNAPKATAGAPNVITSPQQPAGKLPPLDPQLNARYTFDNFVEGHSNKLSRSVALSIAQNPGRSSFNPFFLYGPSGVGKTHLANAIGVKVRQQYPEKRVLFVSANTFKTQYTDSIRHNTQNDFLVFYQTIDVLIIDDIQEIQTEKTQLAFFHIFNHLQQNNRQIIITCDRPPVLFEGIQERMLTRFKWGMVAEMERPDVQLRRDILVSKMRRDGLSFPDDVVQYIAQNVESSVRELEGIVNSIMAYSVVDNCEVDLELTRRVVARAVNLERRSLSADDITQAVCEKYGVKAKDLSAKSRKAALVGARQLAMYLIHKYTDATYSEIGRLFGKRDHSTVLYACNQVASRISTEKAYRREVEDLESAIRPR